MEILSCKLSGTLYCYTYRGFRFLKLSMPNCESYIPSLRTSKVKLVCVSKHLWKLNWSFTRNSQLHEQIWNTGQHERSAEVFIWVNKSTPFWSQSTGMFYFTPFLMILPLVLFINSASALTCTFCRCLLECPFQEYTEMPGSEVLSSQLKFRNADRFF